MVGVRACTETGGNERWLRAEMLVGFIYLFGGMSVGGKYVKAARRVMGAGGCCFSIGAFYICWARMFLAGKVDKSVLLCGQTQV